MHGTKKEPTKVLCCITTIELNYVNNQTIYIYKQSKVKQLIHSSKCTKIKGSCEYKVCVQNMLIDTQHLIRCVSQKYSRCALHE